MNAEYPRQGRWEFVVQRVIDTETETETVSVYVLNWLVLYLQ